MTSTNQLKSNCRVARIVEFRINQKQRINKKQQQEFRTINEQAKQQTQHAGKEAKAYTGQLRNEI